MKNYIVDENKTHFTYDFKDELWQIDDPEWVKARELDWNLNFLERYSQTCDRNQLASRKTYFMKGIWKKESKDTLTLSTRALLAPYKGLEYLDKIIFSEELASNIDSARASLFYSMCSHPLPPTFNPFKGDVEKVLGHYLYCEPKDCLTGLSLIHEKKLKQFPVDLFALHMLFINDAVKWLEDYSSNPSNGLILLVEYWVKSLSLLEPEVIESKKNRQSLRKLLLHVTYPWKYHPDSLASQEKMEFIQKVKQSLDSLDDDKNPLKEIMAELAFSADDDWAKNILKSVDYSSDKNRIDLPQICHHFYAKSESIKIEHLYSIIDIFKEHDFIELSDEYPKLEEVDFNCYLTEAFKKQHNLEKAILARKLNVFFSSEYIGNDLAKISSDLVFIESSDSKENIILLVERPYENYALPLAHTYQGNQKFIINAVKLELGIDFYRHFGYGANYNWDESKRTPKDEAKIEYLNREHILNLDFFILKVGRYGLLAEQSG
ncbi:hypothetical protein [Pleionea sediminis]|uniref:hypothetical protein n=1 Tax=Pleionea sediminis TaxID=2569479 RepID=UPI001185C014|nr:hypothetical protein [Pleionea sediminis]